MPPATRYAATQAHTLRRVCRAADRCPQGRRQRRPCSAGGRQGQPAVEHPGAGRHPPRPPGPLLHDLTLPPPGIRHIHPQATTPVHPEMTPRPPRMDTAATPYKGCASCIAGREERELPTESAHEPPIIPEQPVPIIPADRLVAAPCLRSSPHAELRARSMKSLATSSTSWSGRRSLVCPGPCSVGRGTKAVLSPARAGGEQIAVVSRDHHDLRRDRPIASMAQVRSAGL